MMNKIFVFLSLFLLFSFSYVSAQWVEAPDFVEVSSTQAGSLEEGCFLACMSGMLASINHSKIGTNSTPIIEALNKDLRTSSSTGTFPHPQYDVLAAVLRYLTGLL